MPAKVVSLNLRLPEKLWRKLTRDAMKDHRSLNSLIVSRLSASPATNAKP